MAEAGLGVYKEHLGILAPIISSEMILVREIYEAMERVRRVGRESPENSQNLAGKHHS